MLNSFQSGFVCSSSTRFSEPVLLLQASTVSHLKFKDYQKTMCFSDINANVSKKAKLRISENLDLSITDEKKQHIKIKENGLMFQIF